MSNQDMFNVQFSKNKRNLQFVTAYLSTAHMQIENKGVATIAYKIKKILLGVFRKKKIFDFERNTIFLYNILYILFLYNIEHYSGATKSKLSIFFLSLYYQSSKLRTL